MSQSNFGWKRSTDSGDGLVLLGTKLSPEPLLTQINCTMSLDHKDLIARLAVDQKLVLVRRRQMKSRNYSKLPDINGVALAIKWAMPPLTELWLHFILGHKHSACFIYGIDTLILRTYSRLPFRLFSMCFVFYVHCCLCCNVKRTCEVNMKKIFYQIHGDEAMTTVTKTDLIYDRY